jgi:hypothetical protein
MQVTATPHDPKAINKTLPVVNNEKTPTNIDWSRIFKHVKHAYSEGAKIGENNSGAYFSGVFSGRNKEFEDLTKSLFRDIGHLTSLVTSATIVCSIDKENVYKLLTAYLFTTMLLGRALATSNNATLIYSHFTPNNTPIIKMMTFTAYTIGVMKLADRNIGEKFGELSKVKKALGIWFGTVNAITSTVSWGAGKLSKKFTDISMSHMR